MVDKKDHGLIASSPRSSQSNLLHVPAVQANSSLSYGPSGLRGIFQSRYVVACALFASLGGLLFGYDQGVISVILVMDSFTQRFPKLAESGSFYKGLMTAMIELGAFIGALNCGWVADRYSRKRTISIAIVWFIIGSVLQTAAVDYPMLVVGRLIGGVGIGMLSTVAPLYMSEISSPEIRGSLLVLEEFNIVLGIIISYWFTYATRYWHSEWSWRLPFLTQIIPGLILGTGVVFLPYSPRWLAGKGRDQDSLRALCRLRQLGEDDHRVQREWLEVRADALFQTESLRERHPKCFKGNQEPRFIRLELAAWSDLFRRKTFRRTSIGMLLMFFQQFVGINALIYYAPTLFKTLGLGYNTSLTMSGILNILQLVGVTPCIILMDKIGRRPLLIGGGIVMFFAQLVVAILVALYSGDWENHADKGWVGVSMLFLYMIAFGSSLGVVAWAMPSEIFPSSLRAKGVAVSVCTNWISNFIVGWLTPVLIDRTGFGAFLFFAIFCLMSVVWTIFQVIETACLTLEEIDKSFHDNSGQKDEARRNQIMADLLVETGRLESRSYDEPVHDA